MNDLEVGRTLLLFAWGLGLAGIEIEIEGAYGWAERLPTWYLKRGSVGAVYGLAMSGRPLTGYHVFAFVIPLLVLHLPFVSGIDWSLAGELVTIRHLLRAGRGLGLHVVCAQPRVHGAALPQGHVWWFEQPWIWPFPLDYYWASRCGSC